MALEDGDVSGLKLAVLGTRPSEDALCWTLPLDEWAMPNNEPEETGGPSAALPQKMEVHLPGFSLTAQSYIFPKDKTGLETSAFAGFDAPASTSPLQESRPQFQRHERLTISIENTKLQEALLAEDWGRVVGLLQNVDIKTADPILRFVKAHACLATNRNNESVLLFLSSNSDDLRTWHEWTSHFAQEHTQDAVGQYLLGDGLARLGQYDDAVQAFGRGLKAKTDHALLMNAQGVAYAKLDRLREARRCFDGAVAASNGKLADAYANLGAYWIQRGEGAEGAEAAFTKAIELSGGSAIASHGRLCVRLVLGKATSDEDPSGPQMAFPGLDVLMDENLLRYIEDYASADDVATAVASARTGGTFLSRQYSSRNQRLQSLQTGVTNDLATIDKIRTSNMPGFVKAVATNTVGNFMYRKLEAIQTQYGSAEAAKTVRAQTPQHQVAIADRYATVERWNQGGAQRISGAGRNIAAAGGTAAAAAGALDPEPFSKAGWIAVGGASAGVSSGFNSLQKAQQSRAQQSRTMLQELKPDFDRALANHSIPTVPSMPRGYQPVQIPAPAGVTRTRPAESTAGGADLSMKGINWDDGNWPFRPLFGLLYGLQMVTESSTPRPNVQATN